jgi:hypothetical protein
MLRGELLARTGRHADHQRHAELPARHVPDRGGRVHDLVERQQAEVDRHQLDDGPQPRRAAPIPAPVKPDSDSGVSRMRSSPNSSISPLDTA